LGWKILGTFNKFPDFPEIPVGGFLESKGKKQEIQNRISGEPGNLLKVPGILQPYLQ
jgi:hypothetical protein